MSYRYSKLNIKVRTEAYLEGHEIYSFGRMFNGLFYMQSDTIKYQQKKRKTFKHFMH